jgi:hypothetical protein
MKNRIKRSTLVLQVGGLGGGLALHYLRKTIIAGIPIRSPGIKDGLISVEQSKENNDWRKMREVSSIRGMSFASLKAEKGHGIAKPVYAWY